MNNQEMLRVLDSIARDRNIDKELLITDLEQAMISAARKYYNSLDTEEFACTVDRLTGEMRLTRHGEPLDMTPEKFGRIAAQTFKQVMIQKFREDERASVYEEYVKRVGEIVTGTAQRYEGGALVCTLDNRVEAFMPRSEQIPGEQFHPGDRIRCLILDVRDAGNQVKIVLSRANPEFIRRLFEVEVPEVAERIIEIKAMAREAGYRTKLAVSSIDSKVDAVGACVGVRGSRIKNIVDELNGEKIDIVRWNESSQILIQNALKPAEVAEISLCFELGRATVVVEEGQLSLAIGKRGQNVRLAARLTGWDIDILTPEEFAKGLETMAETLREVEGVEEAMLDRLAAMGIVSVFDVEEVGEEVLVGELEIEETIAGAMVEAASARAKVVAEEQAREKEEAERRRRQEEEAARRLLAGEVSPADMDADLAAAAILGAGPPIASQQSSEGQSPEGESRSDMHSTVHDDRRAREILSGDAPSQREPAQEQTPSGEADPGYDPQGDGPSPPGDTDDLEAEQITDEAVEQTLEKTPRDQDAGWERGTD